MTRALLALALLGAAPLQLSIQLQRQTFDLLDVTGIQIVVHDASASPATIAFETPQEYAIDISRDGRTVWSSPAASPPTEGAPRGHAHPLQPGANILATYEWDERLSNGSSALPGTYRIRVHLRSRPGFAAETTVLFATPLPISALGSMGALGAVTLAGRLDEGGAVLTDSSGSIRLSRRLPWHAGETVAVRGEVSAGMDGSRDFAVERWAPMETANPAE